MEQQIHFCFFYFIKIITKTNEQKHRQIPISADG